LVLKRTLLIVGIFLFNVISIHAQVDENPPIKNQEKFIESKDGLILLKGASYINSVQREDTNTNYEFDTLQKFILQRLENQLFYDFTMFSKSPKIEEGNYTIEIEIGVKANDNLFAFFSDLYNLLEKISVDSNSIKFREESNLALFQVEVKDRQVYFLRNTKSFDLISSIDKLLYLKTGDFEIRTNPLFKTPNSIELTKSNVVANNFIIINRSQSPNAGVYWNWLPYIFNTEFLDIKDKWTVDKKNYLMLTEEFLRNIPSQTSLNEYSDHMSSSINNDRTDFNLILNTKLFFTQKGFEQLESFKIVTIPTNFATSGFRSELLKQVNGNEIRDIDGKKYTAVVFGNQTWSTENLNVSAFRNGDLIQEAKTTEEWNLARDSQQPAWCHANFDRNNQQFGKLYNWFAIKDSRGLAPTGWHIPNDLEWNELINYFGGDSFAGIKMKRKNVWWTTNADGQLPVGFHALATGSINQFGTFVELDETGNWWCSMNKEMADDATCINLSFDDGKLSRDFYKTENGFSVRFLKD
jgi:uncharacterized protein (TIGR02145 family)